MPYKVIYDDIVSYEGSAIVNSLGKSGSLYGEVCFNILHAAQSRELTHYINSLENSKIGQIYITEAGKLPVDKILHLVTPFKKDDDNINSNLKIAITSVIEKAVELGIKDIAIPFLGTGANGYSTKDALDALLSVCADLEEDEEIKNESIIDVTVVAYNSKPQYSFEMCDYSYSYERKERKIRNNFERREASRSMLFSDSKKKNEMTRIMDFMTELKEDELIEISPVRYKYPYDYVEDFISFYNINDSKVMANKGIDRRRKSQYKVTKSLKKIDMLRIAVCLNMTKTQFVQFLIYSGKSLSPKSQMDMFIIDYYEGKYEKVDNAVRLDWLVFSKDVDDWDTSL